ncbi:MAG: 5-deoxy-glucuronate isomerase [Rhodospirillales bacterium]|nr:5-deoxy-glucuronate isomerase [Rhodospirillales bacterium]
MVKLLVKPHAPDQDGCVLSVTPESAGWRYVGFEVLCLEPGQLLRRQSGDREVCAVMLSGRAAIMSDRKDLGVIGERSSVFGGKAWSAYLPARSSFELQAVTAAEVALCSAPGAGKLPARIIGPDRVGYEKRGHGTNQRHVYNILPDSEPAESLLVVEVITPGGHWSSYPPHKHDRDALPEESFLEETYYHRLDPPQGFAFQRVYTDDRSIDETYTIEDGDCLMVPRGYHPVGAPHGYDLYYLNVMAGPNRRWVFKNDPAHEWIIRR